MLLLLLHQRLRQLAMSASGDGGRADNIPARPLLKPWYAVLEHEGATLFHYGRSLVAIRGAGVGGLLQRLLPLLDGAHAVDDIAKEFPPQERTVVFRSVGLMNTRELLLDGPMDTTASEHSGQTARFLGAALGLPIHPNRLASAVEKSVIGIVGSSAAASITHEILSKSGSQAWALSSPDRVPQALDALTLLVAAPSIEQIDSLSAINRACLQARTPWVQILPFDGEIAVVGPVYIPGQTCCYECFRLRRASNSPLGQFLTTSADSSRKSLSAVSVEHAIAGFASLVVFRWLLGPAIEQPGRAFTFGLGGTMSFESHTVYRVPRCPVCSTAAPAPAVRSVVSAISSRPELAESVGQS